MLLILYNFVGCLLFSVAQYANHHYYSSFVPQTLMIFSQLGICDWTRRWAFRYSVESQIYGYVYKVCHWVISFNFGGDKIVGEVLEAILAISH